MKSNGKNKPEQKGHPIFARRASSRKMFKDFQSDRRLLGLKSTKDKADSSDEPGPTSKTTATSESKTKKKP